MLAGTRGTKPTTPGGPTGTSALAAEKPGRGASSPLQSAHEGDVNCALAVVCHHPRGHRGRHQRAALLSATGGVTPRAWPWRRST